VEKQPHLSRRDSTADFSDHAISPYHSGYPLPMEV